MTTTTTTMNTMTNKKWEVRAIHPDQIAQAGFDSQDAAKTWISSHGRIGWFLFYVSKTP